MQKISPTPAIALGTTRHLMAAVLGVATLAIRFAGRTDPPAESARHALILEPYGLGDAISLLPLVEGLTHHGWKVTLCARAPWRDLFPVGTPWIDCRVPWTAYDDQEKYRIPALVSRSLRTLIAELRQQARGAVGLDTRGDIRSQALLWAAGCSRVLSLGQYLQYDLATPRGTAETLPYDPSLRRWQSNLTFLRALCPNASPQAFPLDLRPRWPDLSTPSSDRVIGLIPQAPWAGKTWPTPSWHATIQRIRAAGWSVLGLAGPGQSLAVADSLGVDAGEVVSCDSLEAWARQLGRLRAVVSVDTGPMHLADALRIPLVALYGAGTLPLWAPSSPQSIALHRQEDPDYAPVHPTNEGIARGQALMARHTPDDVIAALQHVAGFPAI